MEVHGHTPVRGRQEQMVKELTSAALLMDSRGVFDAMVRNTCALHGLRRSRACYELTLDSSVKQATAVGTHLRWVAGTDDCRCNDQIKGIGPEGDATASF